MIDLTRLNGHRLVVNCDHMKSARDFQNLAAATDGEDQ
jgi:uncharacterized protein YlzI (FlbEa/FlbD family)